MSCSGGSEERNDVSEGVSSLWGVSLSGFEVGLGVSLGVWGEEGSAGEGPVTTAGSGSAGLRDFWMIFL